MAALVTASLPAEELAFADRTISSHTGKPGALLGILEAIQDRHPQKYLSCDILEYVAEKTEIPLVEETAELSDEHAHRKPVRMIGMGTSIAPGFLVNRVPSAGIEPTSSR